MSFLDSQLVGILGSLEDCSYFSILPIVMQVANQRLPESTLEGLADDFYNYVQICKELKTYYETRLI